MDKRDASIFFGSFLEEVSAITSPGLMSEIWEQISSLIFRVPDKNRKKMAQEAVPTDA